MLCWGIEFHKSRNFLLTSFDKVQPIIWAVDGGRVFLVFDFCGNVSTAPVVSTGLVDSGRFSDPMIPVFLKLLFGSLYSFQLYWFWIVLVEGSPCWSDKSLILCQSSINCSTIGKRKIYLAKLLDYWLSRSYCWYL